MKKEENIYNPCPYMKLPECRLQNKTKLNNEICMLCMLGRIERHMHKLTQHFYTSKIGG